jgi:phosphatidylglycerol:prolipoprotein diacylglycerol transferase
MAFRGWFDLTCVLWSVIRMLPILYAINIPIPLLVWTGLILCAIIVIGGFRQSMSQGIVLSIALLAGSRMLKFKITAASFTDFSQSYPFIIYGYGFMLSMTFVVASVLLFWELKRRNMDTTLVGPATTLAVVFGIIGSKVFDAFDSWDRFIRNPVQFVTNSAGLTFLGGFIFATTAIFIFLYLNRVPILRFCDATCPGMELGYGVARIGCQLSGDGDYGIPTELSIGMPYPHGTVPTLQNVHPTPVYETLGACLIFLVLWSLRKRNKPDGWLFAWYLLLSGAARFLVETIRINKRWVFGLSQSQAISVVLMIIGVAVLVRMRGRTGPETSSVPQSTNA